MRSTELSPRRIFGIAGALLLILSGAEIAAAQEIRTVSHKFKTEAGCPVDLLSSKTDLEVDPFGTPIACRIYLDYKNVSTKPLSGVKFRIGYVDGEDKLCGTFHAPDGQFVLPGGAAKAKWRGEKVDPRTSSLMIRVLLAKYSDGTLWESEKLKDMAKGTGGSAGNDVSDTERGETAGGSQEKSESAESENSAGRAERAKSGRSNRSEKAPEKRSKIEGQPAPDKESDGY